MYGTHHTPIRTPGRGTRIVTGPDGQRTVRTVRYRRPARTVETRRAIAEQMGGVR